MQEVVFDTQAEAETQQAADLVVHLAHHDDNPAYMAQTTRWADPRERLDGKWAYPVCSHQDYTGMTVEDYDPANYPADDPEG